MKRTLQIFLLGLVLSACGKEVPAQIQMAERDTRCPESYSAKFEGWGDCFCQPDDGSFQERKIECGTTKPPAPINSSSW